MKKSDVIKAIQNLMDRKQDMIDYCTEEYGESSIQTMEYLHEWYGLKQALKIVEEM